MDDTPGVPPSEAQSSDILVTRESLYEQAWTIPLAVIAQRYGVSPSYLARVLTELHIPQPPSGYWAPVAVGKLEARPALPAPVLGAPTSWHRDHVFLLESPSTNSLHQRNRRGSGKSSGVISDRHPLLLNIEEYFLKARETETGYSRPSKRSMADLITSRTGLTHTIDFANKLYLAFMKKGLVVELSDASAHLNRESVDCREKPSARYVHPPLWHPQRPTVVYVGSFAFGLTIFEISEYVQVKHVGKQCVRLSTLPLHQRESPFPDGWVMSADMPSGRLCLQIYSPYYRTEWVRRWHETEPGDLDSKIPEIVELLIAEAPDLVSKVQAERERFDRERHRQVAEWEDRQKQEKAKHELNLIQESRDRLELVIQRWAKVNSIRAFFADIEQSAQSLEFAERQAVLERLAKAKELVGELDALKHFETWEPPE